MAPVVPRPERIRDFPDQGSFAEWLAAHHDKEPELWLKIHKKASGLDTVTYAEAVDVALCWGWIDGQRKSLDDISFLQRFGPRKPKSIWSQRNREHVGRLIAEGRMTEHGLREVEAARADGRWDNAYASGARMPFPEDLLAAIEEEPGAMELFGALNATNRYALAFRLHTLKTPAGRARKIQSFVDMLKRGETIYPNGPAGKGK